jgi:glycine/D-amino acid oxidase-like deaminating enzyme
VAALQVVIVGGGVMGAATACFLARDHGAAVTVLERDPRYTRASSALSASSIRVQFSTPVNIALSRWSLRFLRRVGAELAVGDERPQLGLVEPGYLTLASAAGVQALRASHAVQQAHGAEVAWLDPAALRARFAWLHCDDLAAGALGLSTAGSGEGWFDGPALAQALRRKAIACGARFVAAEAVGFDSAADRVVAAVTADGSRHRGDALVIAAGAWSAPLAARLGVDLPVRARKRDVFVFDSPARLPDCPLVVDPSGLWWRPEGRSFLCGAPPRQPWPGDPDEPPLEAVDHGLFDEVLWPALAQRVPGFAALRLRAAWAGYYEMNLYDHNGLAGALPGWANAYTACGFSGHGLQQAPAVGCALAAQIAGATTDAPDLAALAPARIARGQPLVEHHVI